MELFIKFSVASSAISALICLARLGGNYEWPQVVKYSKAERAIGVLLSLSWAAWGAWILWGPK